MAITEPADLLAAWESGIARSGPGRALALHRAARPDADADELLDTPVAVRDAELYALRRTLFGDRMQVVTECADCGEVMEFDLDAAGLADRPRDVPEPLRVAEDGWDVEFRPPTVADLAAASAVGDPAEARRVLEERCTLTAYRGGEPVAACDLPVAMRRRMAEAADSGAEVTLRVACPECGTATRAELDIASYLWTELDSWARELLLDVHLLAGAYGWSEPEILALSPLRRRYYLELCADV